MGLKIIYSDGDTCDGACNACNYRDECEYYNGECLGNCDECYCWSGGCEASLWM